MAYILAMSFFAEINSSLPLGEKAFEGFLLWKKSLPMSDEYLSGIDINIDGNLKISDNVR